jgi:hypothetical protein
MIGRHHDHPDHICRGTSDPDGCESGVDRKASHRVARRSSAAVVSASPVIATAAAPGAPASVPPSSASSGRHSARAATREDSSGDAADTRGSDLTARNTTVEV